jgi:adenylate cyclase
MTMQTIRTLASGLWFYCGLVYAVVWCNTATAQSHAVPDSLQRVLLSNPPDTIKVRLLNKLAWEYRGLQVVRALEYGREAAALATKLGMKADLVTSYNYTGVIFRNMGNYSQAMSYYLKALDLAEQEHIEKEIAYAYNNIGNVYLLQKQYAPALENSMKALAVFERMGDKRGAAYAHLRVGEVYEGQHRLEEAIEYYQASLRIRLELGEKESFITPLFNIGRVYQNLGEDDLAMEYFQRSITIERELNHLKGLAGSLVGMAKLHIKHGEYDSAVTLSSEALASARRASAVQEMRDALQALTDVFAAKQDFARAFAWQSELAHLKDSLHNDEISRQVTSLRAEYEAEKRETEIVGLNENRRWQTVLLNGAVLGLVAFAVLTVVLIRFNRLRRQSNRALRHQNVAIDEERQRSDKLLLNVLPAVIAERIKHGETTIAERFSDATVLFADIVGFTQLSATVSPENLVGMLDAIFSDFDALVEQHGLEKIKTIGDAYMVVGGVPEPTADHVQRVALFALDLVRTIGRYSRPGEEDAVLQIRVGIHTGAVVAGVIGKKRFAYDLWGDTVNTASRMESHSDAGKIQVTESVYNALVGGTFATPSGLKRTFLFEERGAVEVKGKGTRKTYFLYGVTV